MPLLTRTAMMRCRITRAFLVRGEALDLPSGEAIARAMGVEPLSAEEVGLGALGWKSETPLWYYILKEAEVRHHGEQLGAVGGRIVAEMLVGLLAAGPSSYFNAETEWSPTLPARQQGNFTIADLFRFAGVV
jgi:hypothetical protein